MGGKSRELPIISPMFPKKMERVVEPFFGGGAVAFHLEKPSIISDISYDVVNILRVVKSPALFPVFYNMVLKHISIGPNEKEYYKQRDILNDPNEKDALLKAFSFLYVRQLCFSGMHRITKTGKFSVPYGISYKKFSTPLSLSHHNLLQSWEINLSSFEKTLDLTNKNDFLFLDPPYFERNSEYSGGHSMGTSEDLHIKLYDNLKNNKAKWFLVHVDCDLYQDLYKDFNIYKRKFQYAMNFMGRKSETRDVYHLYITNYDNPPLSEKLF